MKKLFLLIIILPNLIIGQIKSTVIDTITQSTIPFVNIWVKNEYTGTTSNQLGQFELPKTKNKTIVLSAIGYETKEITSNSVPNKIYLIPKITELEEILLIQKKGIKEISINKFEKTDLNSSFACGKEPWMNAKFFPYKDNYKNTPFLKAIKVFTISKIKNAKFIIRLYLKNEKGEIGDYLYNENIFGIAEKGKKFTEIDISNLNIQFPKDGVFVAIEWLIVNENEYVYSTKRKSKNKYIKVSDTLYQPNIATTLKDTSENNWTYTKGQWKKMWKYSGDKNTLKKYRNKYPLIAMELKLSN